MCECARAFFFFFFFIKKIAETILKSSITSVNFMKWVKYLDAKN